MRAFLALLLATLVVVSCSGSDKSRQVPPGPDAGVDAGTGGLSSSDAGGGGKPVRDGGIADATAPATDGGRKDASAPALDAGNEGGPVTGGVVDPAPDRTEPGKYGCESCPDSDTSVFELDLGSVTSNRFTGTVTGATGNGEFYLASEDGQSIGGAIPTDAEGAYDFELPLFCGTQTLKMQWENASGVYVTVTKVVTAECTQADIRLTLTWDDKGLDFELHLIKQGGRINDNATDCTWTSCIDTGPDWGVPGDTTDDPRKDVDNTGNYGPENVYYDKPENGTYTVMVEHWGLGTPDADGRVTINLLGQQPQTIDITDLASHHVFTAATIEWPSKKITAIGTDRDCSSNWSNGCLDPIP